MNVTEMERIHNDAEHFARQLEAQTGTTIGFDLASLARLDTFLDEWVSMTSVYDAVDERAVELLVAPIASYVGEVLANVGLARWQPDVSESPALPTLRLCTGQQLDLCDSVRRVLRGLASPAFARLASGIERNSASDDSPL